MTTVPDVQIVGSGTASCVLIRFLTDAGRTWIDEWIDPELPRLGNGVTLERRYVEDIVRSMECDGLVIIYLALS